jgi:hypothetical protein
MAFFDESLFTHRRGHSGRFESICLRCFCVVGKADREFFLIVPEMDHQCREQDLRTAQSVERQEPRSPARQRIQ